jgi:hypothetical protein
LVDAGVLGGSGGKAEDEVIDFIRASAAVAGFTTVPCCIVAMLRIPGVERLLRVLPANGLVGGADGVMFVAILDREVMPFGRRRVSASLFLPFSSLGKSSVSKTESSIPWGVCAVITLEKPVLVARDVIFCLVCKTSEVLDPARFEVVVR